jgi:hypothetical protein
MKDWYYATAGDRKGPVTEEEFRGLAQQGAITPTTLVWSAGMTDWQPYSAIMRGDAPPPIAGGAICAGCRQTFSAGDIVMLDGHPYCARCKPAALQRLREGLGAGTDAEATRNEHLKHEASVKSVGTLYFIGSIVLTLAGIGGSTVFASSAGPREIGVAIILLALGVGQFFIARGLRKLQGWARVVAAIFSGLGLLGFPLGTLINAYILYLLLSAKGNVVFSDAYKQVIAQTPHIKYRTSIIVKIFLAIVVAAVVGLVISFIVYFRPQS